MKQDHIFQYLISFSCCWISFGAISMWWLLISMYVLLSVDGQYWENSSLMYWMTIPPLQDFTPSPVFNSTLLCLFSLLVGTGMAWTFGCISNRLLAIWVATESFNWVGSRIVKILWKSSSKFTIKVPSWKSDKWNYYSYCGKTEFTVGILVLLLLLLVACYQELLVGINISKACTEPQNPSWVDGSQWSPMLPKK